LAAHAHGYVEDEGQEWQIDLRRHRYQREAPVPTGRVPAGERSPHDRDIHFTIPYRVHDARGRRLLIVVAEHAVADDVGDDAAVRQRVRGRRVGVVVADQLDADAQAAQGIVVEGPDDDVTVRPC